MEDMGLEDPLARAFFQSRSQVVRFSLGIIVSCACLYYIFELVDVRLIVNEIVKLPFPYLFAALVFLTLDYWLRVVRWKRMLCLAQPGLRTRDCATPYLASIALNNVLPLRAGDIIRAFVFPKALGIERSYSLATLLIERVLDLVAILLLLMLGFYALQGSVPGWVTVMAVSVAAMACVAALILLFGIRPVRCFLVWLGKTRWFVSIELLKRLINFSIKTADDIDQLLSFRNTIGFMMLTLGIWCFEAAVFGSLMLGLNGPFSIPAVALVASLGSLATLVPSSPGYFGSFHVAAFTGYQLLSGLTEGAAALAVLAHASLWVPTTVVGLLLYFFQRNGNSRYGIHAE